MLRPKEIPWLAAHQIQGRMVFPTAAYLSAAFEAVGFVTRGQPLELTKVEDFVIGQAVVFNDKYSSVESQFTLTDIHMDFESLTAGFSFYSASAKNPMGLDLNASGKISVSLGEPDEDVLPPSPGGGLVSICSKSILSASTSR